MSKLPVDFAPPPLNALIAYHGVHALCTVSADNKRLRATHYAVMLCGGREPIWGLWTVHDTFVRFFGRKSAIADAYPNLVWRRKQATWTLVNVHDMDNSERDRELRGLYRKGRKLAGDEAAKSIQERGDKPAGENGNHLTLVHSKP